MTPCSASPASTSSSGCTSIPKQAASSTRARCSTSCPASARSSPRSPSSVVNLANLPDDSFADLTKKRQVLADVQAKTKDLTLYANLIVGAALASSGKGGLWLTAAKLANEAATRDAVEAAEEKAKGWLATDQPEGAFDRQPLHWPLVFPEVFDPAHPGGPGFDAIIGNPPFLGGKKISGPLGSAYREYIVEIIALGRKGNADLIAYFVLRAHSLLNSSGQTGLIATNTVAQGDTREVGLDQIVASGIEIRQAIKSRPWPSKSAILEFSAVWTSKHVVDSSAERIADEAMVAGISPSLDPASRSSGNPERLTVNANMSFQGSIVLGLGFTMEPTQARELIARDPRNTDVLFPYLIGHDLNSRPDCSASRWVVDFRERPDSEARAYPDAWRWIESSVKSERATKDAGKYPRMVKEWWKHWNSRQALYTKISKLNRVVVITLVSKVVMPVMVPTGQVFAHKLGVFATDDTGMLALLSSAPHYWWAISRSSTMKADLNYSPSDVFETLACPELTAEMRQLGSRLDAFRRELMLSRQAGLTTTYNLVHDPRCTDRDIAELREIHRAIDETVVQAYGWDDLIAAGLDHGFHKTRQGTRYTIGLAERQEILDRLLELNHQRYTAEDKMGLHGKRTRKRPIKGPTKDPTLFLA